MNRGLGLAAALALGFVACAAPAPSRAPTAPATAANPHDVALFYSNEPFELGVPFPSPLVHGSVAGHATTMIVDTGAHVPMISSALAKEAGLGVTGSFNGRDGAGRPVPMQRADHPKVVIDGWGAVADVPTAVGELPEALRRLGVGAIISPQALATATETVVLDLAANRMRLISREEVPTAAPLAPRFMLPGAQLCKYEASPLHAKSLVSRFTIDGTEVLLDLDTGTNGYSVDRNTELGKRLAALPRAAPSRGLGAAGAFEALGVEDVTVRVGELETYSPVNVVAGASGPPCRAIGRAGVDLLRGCILYVGADSLSSSCRLVPIAKPISTADPRCDACMHARCQPSVTECETTPKHCKDFSICAQPCKDRACIDACGARDPAGMALNRCLGESCRDECGW